jgi:hypothetical protein
MLDPAPARVPPAVRAVFGARPACFNRGYGCEKLAGVFVLMNIRLPLMKYLFSGDGLLMRPPETTCHDIKSTKQPHPTYPPPPNQTIFTSFPYHCFYRLFYWQFY